MQASYQQSMNYQQPISYQQTYQVPQQSSNYQQTYQVPQQSMNYQQTYQVPQQSMNYQQTYQVPQQTYQVPQQTYQVPQQTYQVPQQTYQVPQQSSNYQQTYQVPQQTYQVPQQTSNYQQTYQVPQQSSNYQQTYQVPQQPIPNKIILDTPLSLLAATSAASGLDEQKAQLLIAMKYPSGIPIIHMTRKDVLIEIIGMLRSTSFEEVVEFLKDATSPEYILWEQPALDEGRTKVAREIIIQQTEDTGVKGVGKCRFCASTELVFKLMQLRSGDEPATVFVRCTLCGRRWRE